MTKILLFRLARDLGASLASELTRAGYEVATSAIADVRTVLEHQPDLILLQTDVRTLDCCGLLTELKGNETTAPVKVILLAEAGPLERSRALDLGADDVVSIPFEPAELFARIRTQLREKAPDDRLRLEALDARRREREAEAALAMIVAEEGTWKRRWMILGMVAALAVVGVAIAVRNAQLSSKSTASLVLQLGSLRSEIITQDQLLERAQADRAALASRLQQTDLRIGKLENESRVAERIVQDYSDSVCLIYVVLGFKYRQDGAVLRFKGLDTKGKPLTDGRGKLLVTTAGDGPPVHLDVFGSGFLVDAAGHILTNHHVLEPWWHNAREIPVPIDTFQPVIVSIQAYFPESDTALPLHVQSVSEGFDLGLASVDLPASHPRPVTLDPRGATSGDPVVLIGYPTGIDGILARIDEPTLKRIAQVTGNDTAGLVRELARRKLIRPLVTQGHLGVVGPDRLVYDAQTTSGGSGGPLFNGSGNVIGVNFATLSGFSGSNFAVPISHAAEMLEATKSADVLR